MNTTAASAIVVALSLGFVAGVSAAPKSYKSAGPTDEESRQFHEVVAKYKSQAAESCKAAMDMDISPAIADFSS
ncbi:MAG TPA: hypothetical protein VEH84_19500, partial [Alphaproteobacteria bacterium]|nr:hypothetical protein [Alphaproteobacteria bacterium]